MTNVTENTTVTTPAPVAAPTKMDQCRDLFNSMPGARRCDVIKAMTDKVGISKAHAGTYYQTLFTKAKAAAAPAPAVTAALTEESPESAPVSGANDADLMAELNAAVSG